MSVHVCRLSVYRVRRGELQARRQAAPGEFGTACGVNARARTRRRQTRDGLAGRRVHVVCVFVSIENGKMRAAALAKLRAGREAMVLFERKDAGQVPLFSLITPKAAS